jgi:hypothetical protein
VSNRVRADLDPPLLERLEERPGQEARIARRDAAGDDVGRRAEAESLEHRRRTVEDVAVPVVERDQDRPRPERAIAKERVEHLALRHGPVAPALQPEHLPLEVGRVDGQAP